jgi:serine/threonine-protein kinase RsbW
MDTPGATDVVVSVPARPEFMQLLRAAVGSVATRADLTYDAIDDLRIAVDEACARILSLPGSPTTLFLRITLDEAAIEVVAYTDGDTADWPPDRVDDSVTAKILDALTDGVSFERVGASPAVRVLKRAGATK